MVRTDYYDIKWILNAADSTGKLVRWLIHLMEHDFGIVRRAAVKCQAADELSGLLT